ncbi:hypothetical protein BDY21DRAFT_179932 [Lineolata rhizophorae]|uniref:Uncharacterized protein n=1 Tax=Lineolata rhizophorae TaxID=578093 RepID=A0A6A6P7M9_9PEZI|nr:hypothetical protein BDY21DRAFT_179932 [Lineolata rhizophorae]
MVDNQQLLVRNVQSRFKVCNWNIIEPHSLSPHLCPKPIQPGAWRQTDDLLHAQDKTSINFDLSKTYFQKLRVASCDTPTPAPSALTWSLRLRIYLFCKTCKPRDLPTRFRKAWRWENQATSVKPKTAVFTLQRSHTCETLARQLLGTILPSKLRSLTAS